MKEITAVGVMIFLSGIMVGMSTKGLLMIFFNTPNMFIANISTILLGLLMLYIALLQYRDIGISWDNAHNEFGGESNDE